MEMHQVRYFLAVCEELDFTRAARRCGVAEPSLTREIQLLELELRGLLFSRPPAIRLTGLGETVRPLMMDMVRCADEMEQHLIQMRKRQMPASGGCAVEGGAALDTGGEQVH